MNSETLRAFICFEIAENLQEYLEEIIQKGKKFHDPISWSRTQNIHLTLKFLGNIATNQKAQISEALKETSREFQPFEVTIDRLGAFPNFRRPRVFWAGSQEENSTLSILVTQLEDRLSQLGFAKEKRRFAPHLTIGRVRKPGVAKTALFFEYFQFTAQSFICDELIFMKSELNPGGAIYTPLETFPLK